MLNNFKARKLNNDNLSNKLVCLNQRADRDLVILKLYRLTGSLNEISTYISVALTLTSDMIIEMNLCEFYSFHLLRSLIYYCMS